MHKKNRTKYKALDKVSADQRVTSIYEDSDGIWLDLADGYNFEDCTSLRGDTVAAVLRDFARVEEGVPSGAY